MPSIKSMSSEDYDKAFAIASEAYEAGVAKADIVYNRYVDAAYEELWSTPDNIAIEDTAAVFEAEKNYQEAIESAKKLFEITMANLRAKQAEELLNIKLKEAEKNYDETIRELRRVYNDVVYDL